MSLGSLPLVALIAVIFFLVPTSIWKASYDYNFPLHKHKLPLTREIFSFHFPYFFLAFLPSIILFYLFGAQFSSELLAVMFFPTLNGTGSPQLTSKLLNSLFSFLNLGFVILVYVLSALVGFFSGLWRWRKLRKSLAEKKDLYIVDKNGLIGFWGALMPRERLSSRSAEDITSVTLDILTTNQILYSGQLFYYNLEDGKIESIALRNVQRFLTENLAQVNGVIEGKETRERRYDIPGEVTIFLGQNIANINVREIVQESNKLSVISENIQNITTEEFARDLKSALEKMKELNEKLDLKAKT